LGVAPDCQATLKRKKEFAFLAIWPSIWPSVWPSIWPSIWPSGIKKMPKINEITKRLSARCRFCHKKFYPKHLTAKHCSETCQQRYRRAKARFLKWRVMLGLAPAPETN
jgi:hypothetical protein